MADGHSGAVSRALLGLLRGRYSNRISPLEALLRGRRRRIVTSSSTRLGSDVADAARSLFRRRLGGVVVVLIGLGLAWLARWRERRSRRQALALESAAVSTIRDSQLVLRGQISDAYTGATQAGAAPMTPPMAYAVPVPPPQVVPAVAVPVQTCPLGGHVLRTYRTEVDGHTCDNCGRRIVLGEHIWRCAPCDFDKCSSCAADISDSAPQPFAPPAAAVYTAQQEPASQHATVPSENGMASAPPSSAVPQGQVGQAAAANATAVPNAPPSVEQVNMPTATAWAAPAMPIPTDGRAPPMFNPAWVGGVVDRVFVHLQGWIWAPDQALVRAPFTGEAVIAYESRVTQEYEVLVRYKHRRKIKSGRRKGANGKDDPGSDSEYEEEERTRWESRSRTVWSDQRSVETLYIEDTTGRVRLLPGDGNGQRNARAMVLQNPEANIRWASKFTESTFRDFQYEVPDSWSEALANVALSVLTTERIHGYRRTESVVRRGMAFEGAGELSIAQDGALTLQKPTGKPGLMSLTGIGYTSTSSSHGARPHDDLATMPLVAELRRDSTLGTPLLAEKRKGTRRWVVVKWTGGALATVAGVFTALMS